MSKAYNSGLAYPTVVQIYWTDGEKNQTINEPITQSFGGYPAITNEQLADLTLEEYQVRVEALRVYLSTYKYYQLQNFWLVGNTGEKMDLDSCPIDFPNYKFKFENELVEITREYPAVSGSDKVNVISTNNNIAIPFIVQSKPEWINIDISSVFSSIEILYSQNYSTFRSGEIILFQPDSNLTIKIEVLQNEAVKEDIEVTLEITNQITVTSNRDEANVQYQASALQVRPLGSVIVTMQLLIDLYDQNLNIISSETVERSVNMFNGNIAAGSINITQNKVVREISAWSFNPNETIDYILHGKTYPYEQVLKRIIFNCSIDAANNRAILDFTRERIEGNPAADSSFSIYGRFNFYDNNGTFISSQDISSDTSLPNVESGTIYKTYSNPNGYNVKIEIDNILMGYNRQVIVNSIKYYQLFFWNIIEPEPTPKVDLYVLFNHVTNVNGEAQANVPDDTLITIVADAFQKESDQLIESDSSIGSAYMGSGISYNLYWNRNVFDAYLSNFRLVNPIGEYTEIEQKFVWLIGWFDIDNANDRCTLLIRTQNNEPLDRSIMLDLDIWFTNWDTGAGDVFTHFNIPLPEGYIGVQAAQAVEWDGALGINPEDFVAINGQFQNGVDFEQTDRKYPIIICF